MSRFDSYIKRQMHLEYPAEHIIKMLWETFKALSLYRGCMLKESTETKWIMRWMTWQALQSA